MEENFATKLRKGIFSNLGFIMVFLVSIIYLFYGLITLDSSGKTLTEIIISSFVVWLVGYSITQLLTLQGLIIGDKDESVQATKEAHSQAVQKMGDNIVYLEYFCREETANALKTARVSRLTRVGLKYNDYFDKEGSVIEENITIPKSDNEIIEKRNIKKRKAINEAIYMKITALTVDSLTTDNGVKYDPFNFGKNKPEYLKSVAIKSALQKVFIGIGFGYYAINIINDFDWAYLIWTAVQIGIFLLFGSISLFKSYLFVTDTQRQNRIKKINNIDKFNGLDKNRYKLLDKQEKARISKNTTPQDIIEHIDKDIVKEELNYSTKTVINTMQ